MGLTTNGFWYGEDNVVFDPAAWSASQATSMDQWASARQLPDYYWADATGRGSQIGMTAGAEGYQADTQLTYKYNGTSWRAWHSLQPVSFTPAWTNLTIGNATQGATYTLAAGRVFVSGYITFGTTTAMGSNPYMTLPLPANGYIPGAPAGGAVRALGTTILSDISSGQNFPAQLYTLVASSSVYAQFVVQNAAGTYAIANQLTSLIPYTWTTGDFITYDYAYMAD